MLAVTQLLPALAFLPAQNPPWPPAWDMRSSTLGMVCNSSGYTNATFASQLGIASFDWSNAKAQWAADKPMTCEQRLATQAQMTHDASTKPGGRVFSYFNLVKALVRSWSALALHVGARSLHVGARSCPDGFAHTSCLVLTARYTVFPTSPTTAPAHAAVVPQRQRAPC